MNEHTCKNCTHHYHDELYGLDYCSNPDFDWPEGHDTRIDKVDDVRVCEEFKPKSQALTDKGGVGTAKSGGVTSQDGGVQDG